MKILKLHYMNGLRNINYFQSNEYRPYKHGEQVRPNPLGDTGGCHWGSC